MSAGRHFLKTTHGISLSIHLATYGMFLQGLFQVDLPNNLELIIDIIAFFKDGGIGDAEVV
jgi:hypothetical protein